MKKLLLIIFFTAACSGSSSGPSLFDVPTESSADSTSVYGVWAGSITEGSTQAEVRVRIAADSFEAADRCHFADGSSETADAETSARVDPSTVSVTGSADDAAGAGDDICSVHLTPQEIHYSILDGQLTLFELSLDLVKVAD